jgi:hypothetical protein
VYLESASGGRYAVERGITLGSNLAEIWESLQAKGGEGIMTIPKTRSFEPVFFTVLIFQSLSC